MFLRYRQKLKSKSGRAKLKRLCEAIPSLDYVQHEIFSTGMSTAFGIIKYVCLILYSVNQAYFLSAGSFNKNCISDSLKFELDIALVLILFKRLYTLTDSGN